MEVSRLTFSEELVKKMQNPGISKKRKRELRTELILDYIRSKPAGSILSKMELVNAARYNKNSKASGYIFIDSLIKKGIIKAEKAGIGNQSGYEWTIPGDATSLNNVTQPKVDENKPDVPEITPVLNCNCGCNAQNEINSEVTIDNDEYITTLIQTAKDFTWRTNSDSLRGFIDWLSN